MIPCIIQNNMQNFTTAAASPQPFQKCRKAYPVLLRNKCSHQAVALHIIGAKHITYTAFAAKQH